MGISIVLRHLAMAVLFLGISFAPAAATQQPVDPEEVIVRGKIPDPDKKVCKTEPSTGSIIPRRVCRPKWQWELMRQRAIAALEQLDRERRARQHVNDMRENQ
jgi:hypothetical protein